MNLKTISVIALSNRDFDTFDDKLKEAVQWIEIAAAQSADLAVLPEYLNCYCGDGADNPRAMSIQDAALNDWEKQTAVLFAAALRYRIAVTIPVVIREKGRLANVFFLISKTGKILGRYQKMQPTPGELEAGVEPGQPGLIEWDGIKVGGAICFDMSFPGVFASQAKLGAQLFLAPSLSPGGSHLNHYALHHGVPIALSYPAWSRIIDVDGKEIIEGGYRNETLRFGFGIPVYTATLNFDRVVLYADFNQQKIVDIQKRYGRKVVIRYDQPNCYFYLESRAPDLTVQDVIREFDLVSAKDFFARFPRWLSADV